MTNISKLETELNQMIASGQGFPAAFDKFYADDVEMIEGNGDSCKGKEANRKREQAFMASIEKFHGAKLVSSAVGDDVGMSEWSFELTFKDGNRVKMEQVARRRWKNGKVVSERFYYNA